MAFKPLHDRVLVRRVESDEKTKGGLIIPDSAKGKARRRRSDRLWRGRAQGLRRADRYGRQGRVTASCSASGRAPR